MTGVRRTGDRLQSSSDHRLVLDRVDRTRRIDDASALFEHAHRALEDTKLQAKRSRSPRAPSSTHDKQNQKSTFKQQGDPI